MGEIRSSVQRVLDDPFEYVRDEMVCWVFHPAMHVLIYGAFQANGSARKSLVHDLLLEQVGKAHNHEYDETVKAVAASAFFGGFPLHPCPATDADMRRFVVNKREWIL